MHDGLLAFLSNGNAKKDRKITSLPYRTMDIKTSPKLPQAFWSTDALRSGADCEAALKSCLNHST